MVVCTTTRLGRAVSFFASAIAASIAATSRSPSSTAEHLPAVGLVALRDVLDGEAERRRSVERDVVLVVQVDELREPDLPREGSGLGSDALHEVAVGDQRVGVVVHDLVSGAVEAERERPLRERHADRVGRPLPQGARRGLHPRRVVELRMPRRLAPPLPEVLQVVHGQVVARQVQQRVEQHRAVPRREHEAVAVGPRRVARVVPQMAAPQDVGHRRGAHGQAGMTGVRVLDRVDGQGCGFVSIHSWSTSVAVVMPRAPPGKKRVTWCSRPLVEHRRACGGYQE